MPQCVVIADDLTGANATGVLLKKLNLRVSTLMNLERIKLQNLLKYDAITYPTDSRAIEKNMAYNRVFNAAQLLKSSDIKLYNKRIDSTLRGNIGSEIDGILDGLDDNRIAIVVPAFPQAGRISAGGYLLVNGVMVEKTDAGRDAKAPVETSIVEDIVRKQTKYEVCSIYLETVSKGAHVLKEAMTTCVNEGTRIIIIDAINLQDLDIIAEALLLSNLNYVTIDPGPFTAAVAHKLISPPPSDKKGKILMSVGSVTNITRIQVDEVMNAFNTYRVLIDASKLLYEIADRQAEITRVVNEISENIDLYPMFCVITNSVNPEMRLNFDEISRQLGTTEEELSLHINNSIAEVTCQLLKLHPNIKGVFSSGGDITVALCKKMNSSGMELLHEILPLAAYGTLIGGDFPDLKIVTKGGMVGDNQGMIKCIEYLKEQI